MRHLGGVMQGPGAGDERDFRFLLLNDRHRRPVPLQLVGDTRPNSLLVVRHHRREVVARQLAH